MDFLKGLWEKAGDIVNKIPVLRAPGADPSVSVYPVVRPAFYQYNESSAKRAAFEVAYRSDPELWRDSVLLPFMDIIYVADMPHVRMPVTATVLKRRYGVKDEDEFSARIFEEASKNLKTLYDDHATVEDMSMAGITIFGITGPGIAEYASSMPLIPGWIESFRDRVKGTPIVCIPTREVVLITGLDECTSAGVSAVKMLQETAFESFQDAGPVAVSPEVFILKDVDGHPIMVPLSWSLETSALYSRLGTFPTADNVFWTARYGVARAAYSRQQQWLRFHAPFEGLDLPRMRISVSDSSGASSNGPSTTVVFSTCEWREGSGALLPLVDVIKLQYLTGESYHVKWEDVCESFPAKETGDLGEHAVYTQDLEVCHSTHAELALSRCRSSLWTREASYWPPRYRARKLPDVQWSREHDLQVPQ